MNSATVLLLCDCLLVGVEYCCQLWDWRFCIPFSSCRYRNKPRLLTSGTHWVFWFRYKPLGKLWMFTTFNRKLFRHFGKLIGGFANICSFKCIFKPIVIHTIYDFYPNFGHSVKILLFPQSQLTGPGWCTQP